MTEPQTKMTVFLMRAHPLFSPRPGLDACQTLGAVYVMCSLLSVHRVELYSIALRPAPLLADADGQRSVSHTLYAPDTSV